MTPAAPLVGAVTTRPPAAFSSFTASAKRFTQSMITSGSALPRESVRSLRCRAAARRRTLRPPGRMPSRSQPRRIELSIACQTRSTPARTSASGRATRSFSSITVEIERPVLPHTPSSPAPVENGCGGAGGAPSPPTGAPSGPTTKPPPTE